MKEKQGQALLVITFVFALIGVLAVLVANIANSGMRIFSSDTDSLKAFYLAQGGLERAKIEAYNGWTGDSLCANDTDPNCWHKEDPGPNPILWYKYEVVNPGSVDLRLLTVKGRIVDRVGNLKAERQLQVEVNIDTLGVPRSPHQIPWSWREL